MPPWLTFIAQNRTLLGVPKDREGETFNVLIEVDDGRGGSVQQIVTVSVNPNYVIGKLLPLIMVGVLPMIVMFVFVFTLGFAKVPPLPQDKMMDENQKPDFDSYRFLLDQRTKARRRAEKRD